MKPDLYITVHELCIHYQVEQHFFIELTELGLLELAEVEGVPCIHLEKVHHVERFVRLHQDLEINTQGIESVIYLLEKIEILKKELTRTKSRLRLYEKEDE